MVGYLLLAEEAHGQLVTRAVMRRGRSQLAGAVVVRAADAVCWVAVIPSSSRRAAVGWRHRSMHTMVLVSPAGCCDRSARHVQVTMLVCFAGATTCVRGGGVAGVGLCPLGDVCTGAGIGVCPLRAQPVCEVWVLPVCGYARLAMHAPVPTRACIR